MHLVQMGAAQRLIADTNIWACHDCADCTGRCPALARPGRLMGALRHMSIERFAFPGFLARAVNRPLGVALVTALSALLVLAVLERRGCERGAVRGTVQGHEVLPFHLVAPDHARGRHRPH